jgi:uncharacterized protein (TIGR02391 family)
MTDKGEVDLRELLADVNAIKTAMEVTINGTTPDHAKWWSCNNSLISYSNLAKMYNDKTEGNLPVYDITKLASPSNLVWPLQKQRFELAYKDTLILYGRIINHVPYNQPIGFDELLHPLVRNASIKHFISGDYRNAVLDAIVSVFDQIRAKTGLDLDGDNLCGRVFSLGNPILVLSELETESGRNDQSGFMEIFKGFYRGVRNPKAHSLIHDLDGTKAAQYLILASILMRRVVDARCVVGTNTS